MCSSKRPHSVVLSGYGKFVDIIKIVALVSLLFFRR